MENIKKFLKVTYDEGCGCGDGEGHGNFTGSGYGDGYSSGYGSGYVTGEGCGCGDGEGHGNFTGSGYGCGVGDGIKTFNEYTIYMIDGVETIINRVVGNLAKGFTLRDDLILTPCFVIKRDNLFAHGATVKKAEEALEEKIFANMNTDEAIDAFLKEFDLSKKYPAKSFYVWHGRLTGSCEFGRNKFVKEHEIDLENGTYTVEEFIEITKNNFGCEVIKQIADKVKNEKIADV